jgi:glycyl-tRNA synthetase beta chain
MAGASREETLLIYELSSVAGAVKDAVAAEEFTQAMSLLATLRAPVDAFFDKVLVNSPDPEERANRLRLLSQVRNAMGQVADFSQVSG